MPLLPHPWCLVTGCGLQGSKAHARWYRRSPPPGAVPHRVARALLTLLLPRAHGVGGCYFVLPGDLRDTYHLYCRGVPTCHCFGGRNPGTNAHSRCRCSRSARRGRGSGGVTCHTTEPTEPRCQVRDHRSYGCCSCPHRQDLPAYRLRGTHPGAARQLCVQFTRCRKKRPCQAAARGTYRNNATIATTKC